MAVSGYRSEKYLPDSTASAARACCSYHSGAREDALEREAFVSNAVEPVGGPRTEIFIDRGGRGKCELYCIPGFSRRARFVEFWTSVHYTVRVTPVTNERNQYGEMILALEPLQLSSRIYAAAFGLERIMQILWTSRISIISNRCWKISSLIESYLPAHRTNEAKKHIWAIADHLRGLNVRILEGVQELSGKISRSRKYEYRRYIRSLRSHFVMLDLAPDSALIRNVVNKIIETHIEHLPYREIYDKDIADPDAITWEISTRIESLADQVLVGT